jgi:predicted 3-demethylubiquinone-9 3-methyltransferase (glyoxalase superfamily)
MQKITPFLWFDHQAEEAANFYVSVFKDARITAISRFGEGSRGEPGSVMTVAFELEGQQFVALNGGPYFKFSEAVSFYIHCADQAEVDTFWERLTADGGEPGQCGWLKDKFGVSWQVVPDVLIELMNDPDSQKAQRVTQAMLKMTKIDIAELRRVYEQT